jgi:hypothetical protein
MDESEYFDFSFRGLRRLLVARSFTHSYQRCDGTHLEVDFSDDSKVKIKPFAEINDSGESRENEPQCYRK